MSFRSVNPHDPSEVVGEFQEAGPSGVEIAVGRAREALLEWREQPTSVRGDALARMAGDMEKWSEELAHLTVREVGKPVSEARMEVSKAVSVLRYYSQATFASEEETHPLGAAGDWLTCRRHPVGVCALLTPWNSPVGNPILEAAPALGYGNTVVLKPAPAATVVAGTLWTVMAQHLPEGALGFVPGDAETGHLLTEHPDVAAVSFAGSTQAGRLVAQRVARRGARVQCEVGGQNASVVLANADLDAAAESIAYAAMGYAGQKFTATSRVIVEDAVYEDLRERLLSAVESMKVTDPEDELCQVGPLIDEHACASALEALDRSSGKMLTGGEVLDYDGFYLAPTVVEIDYPMDHLAQENAFAPVTVLLRATCAEEALHIANSNRRGIVAAVFTGDLEEAMAFATRLEVGLVLVNAATSRADHSVPFGSLEGSSWRPKESNTAAVDFYTENRAVLIPHDTSGRGWYQER